MRCCSVLFQCAGVLIVVGFCGLVGMVVFIGSVLLGMAGEAALSDPSKASEVFNSLLSLLVVLALLKLSIACFKSAIIIDIKSRIQKFACKISFHENLNDSYVKKF